MAFPIHQGSRTLCCQETPLVLKWNEKTHVYINIPIWLTVWLRQRRGKTHPAQHPDWRGHSMKRSCTPQSPSEAESKEGIYEYYASNPHSSTPCSPPLITYTIPPFLNLMLRKRLIDLLASADVWKHQHTGNRVVWRSAGVQLEVFIFTGKWTRGLIFMKSVTYYLHLPYT